MRDLSTTAPTKPQAKKLIRDDFNPLGRDPRPHTRVKGKIVTDELVIPYQGAVSIQFTEFGDLVLEQFPDDPYCADHVHNVIVRGENVGEFIEALTFLHAETKAKNSAPTTGYEAPERLPVHPTAPTKRRTDNTNAERQRRHREKKRNERNAESIMPRNGVTPSD